MVHIELGYIVYINICLYIYDISVFLYIYTIIYTYIYKDTKYKKTTMCVQRIRFVFTIPQVWWIPEVGPWEWTPPERHNLQANVHMTNTSWSWTVFSKTLWLVGLVVGNGWNMGRFVENRKRMDFLVMRFCDFGGKKHFNQWIEKKSQNSVSLRSSGSWIKSIRFGRLLGNMLKKMICRIFLLIVVIKKYTPWS